MRALKLGIILMGVMLLSGVALADTLCPFDTPIPSTLTFGNFVLDKSIAGTTDGTFIGIESSTYHDDLTTNSYHATTLAIGNTLYASTLTVGNDVSSSKAVEQNGGSASIDEGYYQSAMNLTNLTYCDKVSGGSFTSIGMGSLVSQTVLNAPVDASYTIAVGGANGNGNAVGFSSIYMNAKSMEGNNSTLIDTQESSQFYQFTGNFQYAASDSLRITHPFSQSFYKLSANQVLC